MCILGILVYRDRSRHLGKVPLNPKRAVHSSRNRQGDWLRRESGYVRDKARKQDIEREDK